VKKKEDCCNAKNEYEMAAIHHSTVTLLARLRGWSTSVPLATAT
jgi:hypothetical protein